MHYKLQCTVSDLFTPSSPYLGTGTSEPLDIPASPPSANHVAALQCMQGHELRLMFTSSIRMEKHVISLTLTFTWLLVTDGLV